MDIKYLGHSSFLIKTKTTRIVTDPFDPYVGMKFPKVEADIITVSHGHKDHSRAELVISPMTGAKSVFDIPGEFEKMGVRVTGYGSYHDKKNGQERGENILFKIESEGISVLHCGDLGLVPDDKFLEAIGEVDVLLIPVGGHYTIDSTEAADLVKKVEPSIVIPMHYNQPKLNQEHFGKLSPVSDFLKKFGIENVQPVPKLTVKKEELEDEMKIIVMELT